jgi:hypothetical protein
MNLGIMKKMILLLSCLAAFSLSYSVSFACPACAENLSSDPVNAGISRGIGLTIFFFLGIFGSLVGLVTWFMIKEGRKSQIRHEQIAAEQANPTL